MSNPEQEAKSIIFDVFIQSLRERCKDASKINHFEKDFISLLTDHDLLNSNIGVDKAPHFYYLADQCYKDYAHFLSKEHFMHIFNIFANTERHMFNLIEEYFSPEMKGLVLETIGSTTTEFLRIATHIFDHEDNLDSYCEDIEFAPGLENVHRSLGPRAPQYRVALTYMLHDLTQSYLYGILEKGLRTDYQSYSDFMEKTRFLTDRVTEVLYNLYTQYHYD